MSFSNPKKSIFFATGILFFGLTLNAGANPSGMTVVAGNASSTSNGTTTTITATSNKTIANFSGGFNIAANESTVINQPKASSAFLGRDVSGNVSNILGSLSSNGQIFLVNTNGIIFGQGAVVNAPAIMASTLDIANNDFLSGNYNFTKNGGNAYIINQGRIAAQPGGFVVLLSQAVNNQGVILADSGSIALASGNKMTVALDALDQISVTVDEAVQSEVIGPDGQQIKSAINNSGTIQANGGKVILTAKVMNHVFDYAVNNTGVITAGALVNNGGTIEITASGAPVVNTGSITATTVKINVQNANLVNKGSITASLLQGQANTGNISINALNVFQVGLIAADAQVDITVVGAIEATDPIGDSSPSPLPPVSNLIKGNDVNLVASQFGSPDVPLNIDGNNIDITLTQGNINIGSSLVTNSVVNLRAPPTGPPLGILSIAYNSDANLTLDASTGSINIAPQVEIPANNVTLTAQNDIVIDGTISAPNGTVTLWTPATVDGANATIIANKVVTNPLDATVESWIGGNANWTASTANWSLGVIPNGSQYDVTINQGVVTISSAITVGDLFIGTGATSAALNIIGGSLTLTANALQHTYGNLTIGANGTLNDAAQAISLNGNWINNGGTFTPGTGTVTFNGLFASHEIEGTATSQTFYNLNTSGLFSALSTGGSTTTLDITGNLTLGLGTSFTAPANLYIAGNWINNGTFTAGTGTVTFNGTGTQTISGATTFNNVDIETNGFLTLGSNVTVNNYVTVGANTTFNPNGKTIDFYFAYVYGTLLVDAPTFIGNYAYSIGGMFGPTSIIDYSANGHQTIDLGDVVNLVTSGSGDKTLANPITVWGYLTVGSGTNLNGAYSLIVDGNATFNGTVGSGTALNSLYVGGTTDINTATITTSGTQEYAGAVAVSSNSTLTGTGITFDSTIDGGHNLIISDGGTTTFDGPVGGGTPLTSLNVTAAAIDINGGAVTTTGAQIYNGPVTLSDDALLTGNGITFDSTLDGGYNLTISDKGTTTFGDDIGDNDPLASLTVTAKNIVIDGSITTDGPLTLNTSSDLYIDYPIITNGGDVLLEATGSISNGINGYIITGGGKFTGIADSDRNGIGIFDFGITAYSGIAIDTTNGLNGGQVDLVGSIVSITGTINAGNANVYLAPSKNLTTVALGSAHGIFKITSDMVGYINTTGTVVIGYSPFAGFGTTAGNILMADFYAPGMNIELDTLGSIEREAGGPSPDITTHSLTMHAADGIGSVAPLQTIITYLTATNSTSGNIDLFNTGDLYVLSVVNSAPLASVTLGAASNIYVHHISSTNVYLDATTGSIIGVNPAVLSPVPPVNIDATNIYLTAAGSIYGYYLPISNHISLRFHGIDFLTTDATYIQATAGSYIKIGDTSTVKLGYIGSTASFVYIISMGDIDVYHISASAQGESVTLESEGSIFGMGSALDIDTPNLYLSAAFSISGYYDNFAAHYGSNESLTTNAGYIKAYAGGSIYLYDTGSVELADVEDTPIAVVDVVANGNINVDYVLATSIAILESLNGSVIGNNNGSFPEDVNTPTLYIWASDSIDGKYSPTGAKFPAVDSLTTNANNIHATALNTIDIYDNGTNGPVTLADVEASASGSSVDIVANQSLLVDYVKGNTVTLEALAGNIYGQNLETLSAPEDINTVNLNLNATGSIYGNYNPTVHYPVNNFLTTNAQYVTAYAGGSIIIYDTGSVELVDVEDTVAPVVAIVANGSINVDYVLAYSKAILEAQAGSVIGDNVGGPFAEDVNSPSLYVWASDSIYGEYLPTGIKFTAADSLTTNAGYIKAFAGGSIYLYDITGPVELADVEDGVGVSVVDIVASGDINVDYVYSPNDVTLESQNGHIYGNSTIGNNIETSGLYLSADSSIYGNMYPIDYELGNPQHGFLTTNANTISAYTNGDGAGRINIYNEANGVNNGSTELVDVESKGSDPTVHVIADGWLLVDKVVSGGNARLESLNGSIIGQDSGSINVIADDLQLWADRSIYGEVYPSYNLGNPQHGFLTTNANTISAYTGADKDNSGAGRINIYNEAEADTSNGSTTLVDVESLGSDPTVHVVADGWLLVDKVISGGNARLESLNGSIIGQDSGSINVIADDLKLWADRSIYGEVYPSYNLGNPQHGFLTTNANTISAYTEGSGAGRINIYNEAEADPSNGSTTLVDVESLGSGPTVHVVADGWLLVDKVISGGNARLESLNGSIIGQDSGSINVIANDLQLWADRSIYGNNDPSNNYYSYDHGFLTTNANTISAYTEGAGAGRINIYNEAEADLSNGSTELVDVEANGSVPTIHVIADGSLTVDYVESPTDVELEALDGAIITGTTATYNVIADNLYLYATAGIGSGNALETEVSYLTAYNSTSGNIEIDNAGDLTLEDLAGYGYSVENAGPGDIDITGDSSLTIADLVVASGGDINLTANDNILQNANIEDTGTGTISLTATNGYITMAPGTLTSGTSSGVDFPTNDFTGWLISNPSLSAILKQWMAYYGYIFYPVTGASNFAWLSAGAGADVYATATRGILMIKGQTLSGYAAFDGRDYVPYNDNGYVRIYNSTGSTLIATPWSEGIYAVGSYGHTLWTKWTWTAPATGTYLLQYGMANWSDNSMNSVALFSDVGSPYTGTINYKAAGDINLASLQTKGTVNVTAGGAIINNNGTNNNITANTANLSAVNGIGSGDALNTQISNLNAINTSSGNIEVINEGDLNALSVVNEAEGADAKIKVNDGNLYVDFISSYNVYLTTTGGDIIGQNNDSYPEDVAAMNLYMDASGSIYGNYDPLTNFYTNNNNSFLTTNASYITAIATNDIDIYDLNTTTLQDVETNGEESIDIIANGNINVNYVSDPTDVTLEAWNGSIIGLNDPSIDIDTANLYLYASDSIYGNYYPETFFPYNGDYGFLRTNASYIEANAGNLIHIYDIGNKEDGNVELGNVVVTGGTGSVDIIAQEGDINVDYVSDPIDVTLEAWNGSIIGQNNTDSFNEDINTSNLYLYANDSIYGNYDPLTNFYTNNNNSFLTTNASYITAIATNDIDIYDLNTTTLQDVETGGKDSIDIIANGSINVNYVSDPTDVTLEAWNGSIIGLNNTDYNEDINTQNVYLYAFDSIYGGFTPTGTQFTPVASLTTNANNIYAYASNAIDIYDTGENGPVTLADVVVTNLIYYGNVTLEALDGDITGNNINTLIPSDILTGNLYLSASGSINGNYPSSGGSLTTNANNILATTNNSISIYDTLLGASHVVPSPASINIVVNGSINASFVSAFKKSPPYFKTPEPILLGGGVNAEIQTAAGGVSYDHGLGSGYEAEPTFLFYHPLTDIDGSAFDNIVLDAGAYDFIEDELKNFKGIVPSFFGAP